MQAIILAAGMGKRLKNFTKNNTKCMVQVNGVSLIERMLKQLDALTLDRIIIVTGYEGQKLQDHISSINHTTPVIYVENSVYDKTNNIYSLALAKEYLLEDDTLLLESDLIFEDSVLQLLIDDSRETLALVDKYESWMDGTCVKLGEDDSIESFVPGKKFKFNDIPEYYKTVNIYKFSKHFSSTHYVPFLEAYCSALGNNEYYEQVLRVITMLDEPEIKAKKLSGQLWYEIDDVQDLDIASSMFLENNSEKLQKITQRWGGYWRYPKLLNFAYPCNPFFPPQRLIDEIKANIYKLISEYPSGMNVNTLLVAKNLGLDHASYVAVSNGLEEIIRSIIANTRGIIGCIEPASRELVNRCKEEQIKFFIPSNNDLSYTVEDIIRYFEQTEIEVLIITNPEYHTGNYIAKKNLVQLLDWCRRKEVKLIIDESYCDFAEESNNSLIDSSILERYRNVLVLKNISVTHGVSGLRLGCAVSANTDWIRKVRQSLSIWNINSFAEFYLQIEEKYQKDYIASLQRFKATKKKFVNALSKIVELHAIPSQTNYVLCELKTTVTSRELVEQLLVNYNILLKDMSDMIHNGHQYIKIAIRNDTDNAQLLYALKCFFAQFQSSNGRITGQAINIDDDTTLSFFRTRTKKSLPHRYNYVIYQDSNPEFALQRDLYEKEKIAPYLNITEHSMVLDLGCGVGRWGDEIIPKLTTGKYVGIDYNEDFLKIAEDNFSYSKRCAFYKGSFQESENILRNKGYWAFDTILINGVLMYINDIDIQACLESLDYFMQKGSRIYIKESVGANTRFTLSNFYSSELDSQYNAIYRSLSEYNDLFQEVYVSNGYHIIASDATWKHELENRKETLSWYWIIER